MDGPVASRIENFESFETEVSSYTAEAGVSDDLYLDPACSVQVDEAK